MKNRHHNPAKSHHRPDGFQNNYLSFKGKRLHELWRWKWRAWREGHPRPPAEPIPVVAPDLTAIHANAQAGLAMQAMATWIGHITVLVAGSTSSPTRCSLSAAPRCSSRAPGAIPHPV